MIPYSKSRSDHKFFNGNHKTKKFFILNKICKLYFYLIQFWLISHLNTLKMINLFRIFIKGSIRYPFKAHRHSHQF